MFNVIESAALFEKCAKAGLFMLMINQHSSMEDVYIVGTGALGLLHDGCSVAAYELSELLIAMMKES